MASAAQEIRVIVSADTTGLQKGLGSSQQALKKFSTDFNKDFIGGMTKGTATTKDFGAQLLRAADQAGLGTGEIKRMAGATGIFTKQQIAAGTASATMAAKAKEITQAVKDGTMGTKEAGKAFGELAKEQQVVSKSSTDLIKDFGKFALVAGGAVVAIGAIGKQLYAMGKRGAIVTQTADSFDFLSKKLGLAPDLLDQLRVASRGTIDDMTLMSSTATLLAGTTDEVGKAMGNATPQLLEIAKAANKLNPSLGTTSHMYESLSLGIKRQSPLILDNLGLTIRLGTANSKTAQELGKSVEALTAEEEQMSLLNATLEAGDLLIAQVGGTTESTADAYARMETDITNVKDAMSVMVAEGLTPLVSGLADFFEAARPAHDAYVAMHDAMAAGIITEAELIELDRAQVEGKYSLADVMGILDQKGKEHNETLDQSLFLMYAITPALAAAREEYGLMDGATDEVKASTDLLNISMQTYTDKLLFNMIQSHLTEDAALDLAFQMGLVDKNSYDAAKTVMWLTEKYDENEDGIVTLDEDTDGYMGTLGELRGSLGKTSGSLFGATEKARNLREEIRRLKGKTITIRTKYVTTHTTSQKQHGGPVSFGEPYIVGEAGPELFVPFADGEIIPHGRSGGVSSIGGTIRSGTVNWQEAITEPMQHGGGFTVPSGFPNDSFFAPMRLTSGEQVQVTPRGGSSDNSRVFVFGDLNFHGIEDAESLSDELMELKA